MAGGEDACGPDDEGGEQVVVVGVESHAEEFDDVRNVFSGALALVNAVGGHRREAVLQLCEDFSDQPAQGAGDERVLLVGEVGQVIDLLSPGGETALGNAVRELLGAARASGAQASAPRRRA